MRDYFNIFIPDEEYEVISFEQDDLPGVAVINKNLRRFYPKDTFVWQCSIMVYCEEIKEDGKLTKKEYKILDEFGEYLDRHIKGQFKEKPNAMMLARITWNGTREFVWRVYDPEPVNEFLQYSIDYKIHPREFEFSIEEDSRWELADIHFKVLDY